MEDSPTLDEPWNWSDEFVDFISVCLNKQKELRPSAEQLLAVRCLVAGVLVVLKRVTPWFGYVFVGPLSIRSWPLYPPGGASTD